MPKLDPGALVFHRTFQKVMEVVYITENTAKVIVIKRKECQEFIKEIFPEVTHYKARLNTVRLEDIEEI